MKSKQRLVLRQKDHPRPVPVFSIDFLSDEAERRLVLPTIGREATPTKPRIIIAQGSFGHSCQYDNFTVPSSHNQIRGRIDILAANRIPVRLRSRR